MERLTTISYEMDEVRRAQAMLLTHALDNASGV